MSKAKKVETPKNSDVVVNSVADNSAMLEELKKMKAEIDRLKANQINDVEKAAIEAAREEMITDDELGPCYIDPKYTEEGYFYRITDTTRPGKIQRMLRAGYEIVYENAKVGDNIVTNTSSLTGAVTVNLGGTDLNRPGVLMRIPQEQYDKRQLAKARANREQSAALYQGMADDSDFGEITIGNKSFKK